MTIVTSTSSREQLVLRRDGLLARLGTTIDELAERRSAGHLTPDEWEAWEELDGISYLLGDPA